MSLPISVIIPHVSRRERFLRQWVLPSIEAQGPAEVLVIDGDEIGACAARNKGLLAAEQPMVFFCDDDITLLPDCLARLKAALDGDPFAAFSYSDYTLVSPNVPGEEPRRSRAVTGPFDYARLRQQSYIPTMALIRRERAPQWDPALRRMQDWDFWLSVTSRGDRGVHLPEPLFEYHRIDLGISATEPLEPALALIFKKHGAKPR